MTRVEEAAGVTVEMEELEDFEEEVVWSQPDLASRLRELRRWAGASRRRISLMTGISQALLRKYESGQALPTPEHLLRLSEVYNASVLFLVRGENPPSAVDLASMRLAWTRIGITPRQATMVLRLVEGILSQLPSPGDVVN